MNNALKYVLLLVVALLSTACGKTSDTAEKAKAPEAKTESKIETPKVAAKAEPVAQKADPKDDLGIGPIKAAVKLGDLDDTLAEAGKKIYKEKCTACHKLKKRYIGPALKGVTKRRRAAWIMNMILNPVEMIKKDATAKALLQEYSAPMADQSLSKDEARSVLEYFRRVDSK